MVRPPATMRRGWGGNNSTDENVEEYYENDEAVMQENGMEETICAMRLTENLEDPERADVYTVHGGRIRTITSFDLPILKHLQLSAKRGYLYKVSNNFAFLLHIRDLHWGKSNISGDNY